MVVVMVVVVVMMVWLLFCSVCCCCHLVWMNVFVCLCCVWLCVHVVRVSVCIRCPAGFVTLWMLFDSNKYKLQMHEIHNTRHSQASKQPTTCTPFIQTK